MRPISALGVDVATALAKAWLQKYLGGTGDDINV